MKDLDALIAAPRGIRFQGQVHVIRAIDQKTFIQVSLAFSQLDRLRLSDRVDANALIDGYAELFSAVCSTITRRHVEQMTLAQCSALYVEILSQVTGEVQKKSEPASSQEKKNALIS